MSDADGIFEFDYAAWATLFPTLATSIDDPTATAYFGVAELYLQNNGCSQVIPLAKRGLILNLLTAHVASLIGTINGQVNPLVGRISQATEGSVSVSVDFPTNPNAAWFNQTPYGALAWQALAPWHTALYVAAPQIPLAAQSFPGMAGVYPYGIMPFNGGFPWPGRC